MLSYPDTSPYTVSIADTVRTAMMTSKSNEAM